MIKQWLLDRASPAEVPNFEHEYKRLLEYQTVAFTANGKQYCFTREDIIKKREASCRSCQALRFELETLKAKLDEKEVKPDLRLVIKRYIKLNFEPCRDRTIPRRYFLSILNDYLAKTFGLAIHEKSATWAYVIREVLKDRSTQYRKLKLKKRIM
jgi:hypothetical protein